ncbi:hypothetical protein AcW1_009731 [Taiwanofungus camphoratus]|nr:hypothetical protein AcV7_002470 [Antrodia cinnamomea]KAI0948139.1 hypothetical protein AcW1_009731 [Antrodia cinnamomea]
MSYHDMRNVNCNSHTVTPLEYPIAVFTPGVGRDLPPGSPRRICKVTYTPIPRPQSGQLPSLNTAKRISSPSNGQAYPKPSASAFSLPSIDMAISGPQSLRFRTIRPCTASFQVVSAATLSLSISPQD